ncbi:MAG TPA: single-stranded-DNA-specific exonuclease RecJ [Candidatus Paceibacterota bacterium]|jgi:single-stranded-DNA-specific exonuclease|nr:single-stranded-DNA-specific exonuclease RecJ [Parcubacteria group bacterium]MDP6119361.1 single-stranded-DNA-specific exonuclease RecJ [Candidatus Paceibacterota bacterium]HJN62663.1 single-stranded-DNA-specific exonuclease RecJ [Candidatus Paceibacterota bacterium]|tara:strand:- start:228 stop:1931 length:1704 start_codon:yes stop_codon:yes gene_type:complete
MKNYQIREEVPENVQKKLSGYSPLTQKLLFNRGIDTKEKAENFFNPNYEDLNSPLLLKDMGKAVERILGAIKKNEKILIYSDYDADGIPGAVIFHDFFKKIGFDNFENYIPHRNDEGFGLNIDAVKSFSKDKFNLIITVDCGINDVKEVEEANKLGIDVVITDHHLPNGELPKALAIVNPNQKGDKHPFKSLCGAAVAFKLVQALIERGNFEIINGWDKWLLDMVGLATISDMVPLIDENRILSYYGLLVLKKTRRYGLKNLYNEARLSANFITEDDISFVITPRINAASRMDEAYTAFNLLKSEDIVEAKEGAERLSKLNNERKILTATIVKEIKRKLSKMEKIPPVIVAGNPKWVPSILGLVAGNLADTFNRPVFLWGRNGYKEIKGSCRSDQRTDVFSLMQKMPDNFFTHFGGHKFSGGFGISGGKIHFLEEEIIKHFKKDEKTKSHDEKVLIDSKLSLSDINWDVIKEIEQLSPYGTGNEKPVFIFDDLPLPKLQKFGKHSEHLKLEFPNGSNRPISAISFFSDENSFQRPIKEGEKASIVASIEKSYFRNFPELRLRIVDII